jgi:hypothetical protein
MTTTTAIEILVRRRILRRALLSDLPIISSAAPPVHTRRGMAIAAERPLEGE